MQELIYYQLKSLSLKYENRTQKKEIKQLKISLSNHKSMHEYYKNECRQLEDLLDGNAEICASLIKELRGEK